MAGELRAGVSAYIDYPQVHTKYLDWYCADTLVYNEWYSNFENWQPYLVGFSGALANSAGGPWLFAAAAWRILWSIAKWLAWLFIVLFAYENIGPPWGWVAVALIVFFTALRQYQLRRGRGKMCLLLNEMRTVYEILQSPTFSCEVLWQELNRTRELGAVWPGELYKLVENKRRS